MSHEENQLMGSEIDILYKKIEELDSYVQDNRLIIVFPSEGENNKVLYIPEEIVEASNISVDWDHSLVYEDPVCVLLKIAKDNDIQEFLDTNGLVLLENCKSFLLMYK